MMRKLATILLLAVLLSTYACNEVDDSEGKTTIIQDSLIHVLPTWQALKIVVSDDRSQMHVVVGDASFYTASADVKNQKATELGEMILRIYGKNNHLQTGDLTVTKDIHNTSEKPADGVSVPIDFAGLKKAGN